MEKQYQLGEQVYFKDKFWLIYGFDDQKLKLICHDPKTQMTSVDSASEEEVSQTLAVFEQMQQTIAELRERVIDLNAKLLDKTSIHFGIGNLITAVGSDGKIVAKIGTLEKESKSELEIKLQAIRDAIDHSRNCAYIFHKGMSHFDAINLAYSNMLGYAELIAEQAKYEESKNESKNDQIDIK